MGQIHTIKFRAVWVMDIQRRPDQKVHDSSESLQDTHLQLTSKLYEAEEKQERNCFKPINYNNKSCIQSSGAITVEASEGAEPGEAIQRADTDRGLL